MESLNLVQLLTLTEHGQIGVHDVACPLCGPERRQSRNRIRKVLRIWVQPDGFMSYHCQRCLSHGWAIDARADGVVRTLKTKPQAQTYSSEVVADLLWRSSKPAPGSLVETYLRWRRCWVETPAIRFLPARKGYFPTMIARFGIGAVHGVHLTRLARTGKGKAGSDADKRTLGPSIGLPIVIRAAESGNLFITEGIEDALSIARVTDWSVWAAGSAGRVAKLMDLATAYDRVCLVVDRDQAGQMALTSAREQRQDLLAFDAAEDPNTILVEYGERCLVDALAHVM